MTRARNILILTADISRENSLVLPWLEPFLRDDAHAGKNGGEAAVNALQEAVVRKTTDSQVLLFGSPFQVRLCSTDKEFPACAASEERQEIGLFPAKPAEEPAVPPEPETPKLLGTGALTPLKNGPADTTGLAAGVLRMQLGNMIHGWFAVYFGMSEEQRQHEESSGRMEQRLRHFCTLWNSPVPLWHEAEKPLMDMCLSLKEAIAAWFRACTENSLSDTLRIRTEWPLEEHVVSPAFGGTAGRTEIMRLDMLVEILHEDGTYGPCLIIDHKCGDYANLTDEALKEQLLHDYAPRQTDYARALRLMGRDCRYWLHLPLEGKIFELVRKGDE